LALKEGEPGLDPMGKVLPERGAEEIAVVLMGKGREGDIGGGMKHQPTLKGCEIAEDQLRKEGGGKSTEFWSGLENYFNHSCRTGGENTWNRRKKKP